MNKEIDLQNYQIHTDLVVESLDNVLDKIETENTLEGSVKVTRVFLPKDYEQELGKKAGNYITIEFKDVTDKNNYDEVLKITVRELNKIINEFNLKQDDLILVLGLGNRKSTPDALGPMTMEQVLVTNHLFLLEEASSGFRPVAVISPGVMAQTGLETSDFIESIVNKLNPKLLIVVDALASQSMDRVNRTIQFTDTGIAPGSGIGNYRKEISKEVLGIPVVAIGVPTVVSAATIVSDTIEYMLKYLNYSKRDQTKPSSKLYPSTLVNYWDSPELEDNKQEDIEILGQIGSLNEQEKRQFIYEILMPTGYNFMVTPKEVDFVIEKLSSLIASAINKTLHDAYED